jgi:hypothetical protein
MSSCLYDGMYSTGQVTIEIFVQFLKALRIRNRVSYVGTATN